MRIFYKTTAFAEDKEVTVFFIKPDLTQSKTFTLTHWSEGVYYIDVSFTGDEAYCGKFFEDGIGTIIKSFGNRRTYGEVVYRVKGTTVTEV